MRSRYPFLSFVIALLLLAAGSAYAAAPLPQTREEKLRHVCTGGPSKGQECAEDSQCARSKCEIDFLRGPNTTFQATVTLIVDDDVSKFDDTEEIFDVKAA